MRLFILTLYLIIPTQTQKTETNEDEELSELPFNVDDFPAFLEDTAKIDQIIVQNDLQVPHNDKKRLFDSLGPPGIGSDLFDQKQSTETDSTDGSGMNFEDISIETENLNEIPTPSSILESQKYPEDSNENGNIVEKSVEDDSNSTILLDQNTSDLEVEPKNEEGETSVVVQAELETTLTKQKPEKIGDFGKAITRLSVVDKITDNGCPPPKFCGRNCFVSINADGCQDCQCLWQSSDCKTNNDCRQSNQFCDLGKCNCVPGFRQNMKISGVCEVDPESKVSNFELARNTILGRHLNLKDISKQLASKKISKREAKPRRAERLEWPGVCDKHEQCPENLVCIHGDCWSLPEKIAEKMKRSEKMIISRSADEKSLKKVSFDTDKVNKNLETTTQGLTKKETLKRGMARFVSEDFAKQLKRTTAKVKQFESSTLTTLPTPLSTTTGFSQVSEIPLTVDKFFLIETTTSKIEDDHKMENLIEEENFGKINFLGDNGMEELSTISPSYIKKIHLSNEPESFETTTRKGKRHRTTTSIPDSSENSSELDSVEFPISSMIQKSGLKPRALSAEPTPEELRDHKKLVDIFSNAKNEEELETFNENIEMSVTTKYPFPTAPELPPIDPIKKPYIIRPTTKFTTIAPLENIGIEMSTDEPPGDTPSPAPYEEHLIGVWYPMRKGDIPHLGIFASELRRFPKEKVKSLDEVRLYNEYTKANRMNKPIRIEMDNANGIVKNECETDSNCGSRTVCCTKKWCDRTNNCGTGRFCLPSCSSSKLTFLPSSRNPESIIDIMYD